MPVLLGMDWGERRVGLALTDESGMMAFPFKTLEIRGRRHLLSELEPIVKQYRVTGIIVGLPRNMNGEEGPAAVRVQEEVAWFKERLLVEWKLWDERLTSREVDRVLDEAGMREKKRKGIRDQLAAQRILQSYMDCHPI